MFAFVGHGWESQGNTFLVVRDSNVANLDLGDGMCQGTLQQPAGDVYVDASAGQLLHSTACELSSCCIDVNKLHAHLARSRRTCGYPPTIFLLDCCRTHLQLQLQAPGPPRTFPPHKQAYTGTEYPNMFVIHTTNKGNTAGDGGHEGYGPFMPRFCDKLVQPNMPVEVT
jgi:hypothetical protein